MAAYKFTVDWHSHIAHVWRAQLQPFVGKPVHALEIGSFEGRSACWLLDNVLTHADARLTCIDPHYQSSFLGNLVESGSHHKVTPLHGTCVQKVAELIQRGATFDFIYVDGLHTPESVLTDAVMAWQVSKPGTVLIFDDYAHPKTPTRLGVEPFMAAFWPQAEVLHREYQIILRRK